jgi:hypothetical protein
MKDKLIARLTDHDSKRDRSVQVDVGPSEIGGCRRRLWHRVNGSEITNTQTKRLAAIMGTAIHAHIESLFGDDPAYLVESEFEAGGVRGHIDLMADNGDGTWSVWDWKTTTRSSLPWFGSDQQKSQVQIYGWLASQNGHPVTRVGLVGICRDGDEDDIIERSWDYNEAAALEAIERLEQVKAMFDAPTPEKDAAFCKSYCPYFGACPGIESPSADALIDNPEMVTLIKEYRDLQGESKRIEKALDAAKEALQGTNGTTPDGTVVKWASVAGRQTIDEAAVEAAMGYVPRKQGAGYNRLTVK